MRAEQEDGPSQERAEPSPRAAHAQGKEGENVMTSHGRGKRKGWAPFYKPSTPEKKLTTKVRASEALFSPCPPHSKAKRDGREFGFDRPPG